MTLIDQYSSGTFCWPELVASDVNTAKEFYSTLFDWEIKDVPIGEDKYYSMAYVEGKEVGALYEMWDEQKEHNVPTHWANYVAVRDVDEVVKRVQDLGGHIIVEPMDVFDAGRMASVQDPTGGIVSLWQAGAHIGARLVNEHGTLCWNELLTNNTDKAREFYCELFDWTANTEDFSGVDYTIFMNGEKPAAGMMKLNDEMGNMPPSWITYFAIDDCESAVQTSVELGSTVLTPPTDIPDVGIFAVIQDLQGAVFSIIQLLEQPE